MPSTHYPIYRYLIGSTDNSYEGSNLVSYKYFILVTLHVTVNFRVTYYYQKREKEKEREEGGRRWGEKEREVGF